MKRVVLQTGVALLVLASGATTGLALGQDTSAAREEAKQLGTVLAARARAAASATPDASWVPNYSPSAANTDLIDDPDAIADRAAAAVSANERYATVRSSINRRPRVAAAEVQATIARGKAVAADAGTYVRGLAVSGSSGSCRQLPPSSDGSVPYEATCNVGATIQQAERSCTVSVRTRTTEQSIYRYWAESPTHTGLSPAMSEFSAALGDGRCVVEGPADPCQVTRHYGLQPSGRCSRFSTNVVRCSTEIAGLSGNPVPATGQVWFDRTIERSVTPYVDESGCTSLTGDASCTRGTDTCTSSDPVTRMIDGVPVTQPCWAWTRTYTCETRGQAEDCGALDANKNCRFEREDCLTEDDPCPTRERVYRCTAPADRPAEPQYICDGDVYCLGGECETIDRQPNAEFKDAAVALHAAAQAEGEFDPQTLRLFKGSRETCHSAVFGVLNCCAGKAFPLIPAGQLLVSLGCDREEILLHQRDSQGLCAYVGSYCLTKVLGLCTTKRKAYCCFESKLSRILQEQGRAQIGKGWGPAKSESCQGFTAEEFASLDLSRTDFSEVYAEFQDAAKLPEELSTSELLQQRIADYYRQAQPQ